LKLYPALGISSGDVVAFVGAGGKSSAIIAVAGELVGDGMTAIAVPTTKMQVGEAERVGRVVIAGEEGWLGRLKEAVTDSGAAAVGSAYISGGRIGGLGLDEVAPLGRIADVVLVEADGARRKPLKGTAEHEPAIPRGTTLVVAVANIGALGRPATEEHIHRPEVFSRLTGLSSGQSVTPRAFALALSGGSLARVPSGARSAVLLTGVSPGRSMSDAAVVTRELWRQGISRIVFTSLPSEGPVQVWVP